MVCAEPLDLSDQNFKPCQCGLQVSDPRNNPMTPCSCFFIRFVNSVTTSSCETIQGAQVVVESMTPRPSSSNLSTSKSTYHRNDMGNVSSC